MAVRFSTNQLNYARKKYYGKIYVTKSDLGAFDKIINKLLIYLYQTKYTLVNLKRKFIRIINFSFNKFSNGKKFNFSINIEKNSYEKIIDDLKVKNYTYIENFLTSESHYLIKNNWPSINYFSHTKQIIKHFSFRREWPDKNTFDGFKKFYELRAFYNFILSDEFKNFFNNLVSYEKKKYRICAISSSMAPRDSYLIPHIDGVIGNKDKKKNYNFIYFVDGFNQNPSIGGGTGFYKDNEFKDPIFIPKSLINSLIIYNQCEDFYHGFKTIDCPKDVYRKAINFQITSE